MPRQKVIAFIALHTRFSVEDLQGYRDIPLERILEGIARDTAKEDVRIWAETALSDREWRQD